MTRRRLAVLLVAAAAVSTATAVAGAALATPNSGVLSSSVVEKSSLR